MDTPGVAVDYTSTIVSRSHRPLDGQTCDHGDLYMTKMWTSTRTTYLTRRQYLWEASTSTGVALGMNRDLREYLDNTEKSLK